MSLYTQLFVLTHDIWDDSVPGDVTHVAGVYRTKRDALADCDGLRNPTLHETLLVDDPPWGGWPASTPEFLACLKRE